MGLSVTKLLLILLIVLVVFGAGKLPKIMGDVGKGVKALRDGLKDDDVETKPTAEVQIPVNKKEDV
jgi:sec-independent protein translocase protein TatA